MRRYFRTLSSELDPTADRDLECPSITNTWIVPEFMAAEATIFDVKAEAFDADSVVQCMVERGFCILRNLFELPDLDEVEKRTRGHCQTNAN